MHFMRKGAESVHMGIEEEGCPYHKDPFKMYRTGYAGVQEGRGTGDEGVQGRRGYPRKMDQTAAKRAFENIL